ncbi:ester cyclase [Zavarzinella formosa]|uniref:ester cyclase n=1 Tax=Zavarzinella formosa TaxID=360055 RepID=UPI00031216B6|nr:ester cyclase [Zavarzinella formosa]
MAHENIGIVRRWFEEIWNQRKPEVIDELLVAESTCYSDEGPIVGPQEFKDKQYYPLIAAFPDMRVKVESVIGDGDQVAIRWSAVGTHTGDGLGFKETHSQVAFNGMSWIHVRNGKMMEGWQVSNITEAVRGLAAKAATLE